MAYFQGFRFHASLIAISFALPFYGCDSGDADGDSEPTAINKAPDAVAPGGPVAPVAPPAGQEPGLPPGGAPLEEPIVEDEVNPLYDCTRSIDVNYYDEPINIPASQSPPGGLPSWRAFSGQQ